MGKTEKCLLMVEQAVLEDRGMKKRMKKRMRMGVGCRLLGLCSVLTSDYNNPMLFFILRLERKKKTANISDYDSPALLPIR